MSSGLRIVMGSSSSGGGSGDKYIGDSAFATTSDNMSANSVGSGGPSSSSSLGNGGIGGGGALETQSTGGGGYGGLTGLMGRVLGASSHPTSGSVQGANLLSKRFFVSHATFALFLHII